MERYFTVKHKEGFYYVSYLNSDGPIMGLLNRLDWEILDEELCLCEFQNDTKEEKQQIKNNIRLANNLISFCIRHFNNYKPKLVIL